MISNNAHMPFIIILLMLVSIPLGHSQGITTNTLKIEFWVKKNILYFDSILNQPKTPSQLRQILPEYITALKEADPIDIYFLEYKLGQSKYYYETTTQITNYTWDIWITASSTIVYKDFKSMEVLQVDPTQSESTAYKSHLATEKDWNIIENSDTTILGYQCKYAEWIKESKVKVKAWYTTEISVFDGPGTFAGLPGLILRVSTPSEDYLARQISYVIDEREFIIPQFEEIIDKSD